MKKIFTLAFTIFVLLQSMNFSAGFPSIILRDLFFPVMLLTPVVSFIWFMVNVIRKNNKTARENRHKIVDNATQKENELIMSLYIVSCVALFFTSLRR